MTHPPRLPIWIALAWLAAACGAQKGGTDSGPATSVPASTDSDPASDTDVADTDIADTDVADTDTDVADTDTDVADTDVADTDTGQAAGTAHTGRIGDPPTGDTGLPIGGPDTHTAVPLDTHTGVDTGLAPLLFVEDPEIHGAPNPDTTPLVRRLTLATNRPTSVEVGLDDGERQWILPFADLTLDHDHLLLGYRADRHIDVTVTATDDQGEAIVWGGPLFFDTAPLPADIPPYTVIVGDAARMEPGFTVLSPVWGNLENHYAFAIDSGGEIVWLHRLDEAAGELLWTADRTLIYQHELGRSAEIDIAGTLLNSWTPTAMADGRPQEVVVDIDVFHHDLLELPDGDLAALSAELRIVPDFPSDENDPYAPRVTAEVGAAVHVVFARDGTVIERLHYLDVLDPTRIAYDALTSQFWWPIYGQDAEDWGHANSLVYDPVDDAWITSLRHQDAVVKIDRQTGALKWILGPHPHWTPAHQPYLLDPVDPQMKWNYHQHAAMLTPTGTVMLFDNGNARASLYEPPLPVAERFSRAVEFRVDEGAMTVEQVWQYGEELVPAIISNAMGEAEMLPVTGNVLVNFGATPLAGNYGSIVREVTHTEPADVLWQVTVQKLNAQGPRLYRTERWPSFYP